MTDERAADLEVYLDGADLHEAVRAGVISKGELLELLKDRERMERAERALKIEECWPFVEIDSRNATIVARSSMDGWECVYAPTLREALDQMPEG